jgi:hypothetical protein
VTVVRKREGGEREKRVTERERERERERGRENKIFGGRGRSGREHKQFWYKRNNFTFQKSYSLNPLA